MIRIMMGQGFSIVVIWQWITELLGFSSGSDSIDGVSRLNCEEEVCTGLDHADNQVRETAPDHMTMTAESVLSSMTTLDNHREPDDPAKANQCPSIAGPIVADFVDWLKNQGVSGNFDTHQVEYLYYEFASGTDSPLLEKNVLFRHLAEHGIARSKTPRDLRPQEWRYTRDKRLGKKRPRVCTYRIEFAAMHHGQATNEAA